MALTINHKNSNSTSVLYDHANKKTMAVYLPQDIILFQILTWVPAKSVIRFKCVSKQWNSFIMSDRFKEMHNHNQLKDLHLEDQNLFFYSLTAPTFFTINCESLPIKTPCSRPLPQFEAGPPRYVSILTSYHGLVCLSLRSSKHDYQDNQIILWNPLTTEHKRLSKPSNPDHMECYNSYAEGHGLYYTSCEDDYKLLVVTESHNVYIYSLKSDSWRKLNKKAPFQELGWRPGFYLSENIYFHGPNIAGLIRFDTTAERFHKIETTPKYDNYSRFATTVHRGSIHLCVKYNIYGQTGCMKSTCMELWKFNADRDSWSKVVTYQLRPNEDICYMFPSHLMSNGNWLMKCYTYKGTICQVELKKKYTEDKVGHDELFKRKKVGHDEYKLYYLKFEGVIGKVKYTETFVSPNQYMK